MAIEGPLRELGIHDVFQLLDLSRKTGVLRVTSELRDDEGVVLFDGGRVVHATIRSKAMSIELMLLQAGKISEARSRARARAAHERRAERGRRRSARRGGRVTQKELERQLRLQIESVVFELMSWREGFFSFEERAVGDMPARRAHHASRPNRCSWKARAASTNGRASRTTFPNLGVDRRARAGASDGP